MIRESFIFLCFCKCDLLKVEEDSSEARLFRQHSRSIYNATALSSFAVNERRQESSTSSVVMQGKLIQQIGRRAALA